MFENGSLGTYFVGGGEGELEEGKGGRKYKKIIARSNQAKKPLHAGKL